MGNEEGEVKGPMLKEDYPITPAIRFLREKKIVFVPFLYRYEEHGGTHQFAAEFNVPDHQVIKTLVFETDRKMHLLVPDAWRPGGFYKTDGAHYRSKASNSVQCRHSAAQHRLSVRWNKSIWNAAPIASLCGKDYIEFKKNIYQWWKTRLHYPDHFARSSRGIRYHRS